MRVSRRNRTFICRLSGDCTGRCASETFRTGPGNRTQQLAVCRTAAVSSLLVRQVVGVTGIEPAVSCSRSRRDTTSLHPDDGRPLARGRVSTAVDSVERLLLPHGRRSERGNRTLRVRRMKPTSPPGDLLAAFAGRQGIEPCREVLETKPSPSSARPMRPARASHRDGGGTPPRAAHARTSRSDSGRTRTFILRFVISDPDPLEDGVKKHTKLVASLRRIELRSTP